MEKSTIANSQSPVPERATIVIAGMTCDHCVKRVERALRSLPGVKEVVVDLARAVAQVTFEGSVVSIPAMHQALLKSGYKPVEAPYP